MRVKILRDDDRFNVKRGEIYKAARYTYDPHNKISLLHREGDGFDPRCNQYIDDVALWIGGQWMIVRDGKYVPENHINLNGVRA